MKNRTLTEKLRDAVLPSVFKSDQGKFLDAIQGIASINQNHSVQTQIGLKVRRLFWILIASGAVVKACDSASENVSQDPVQDAVVAPREPLSQVQPRLIRDHEDFYKAAVDLRSEDPVKAREYALTAEQMGHSPAEVQEFLEGLQ